MIRRRAVLALAGDLRASDVNRSLVSLLDELGRTGAVDPARTRVVAGHGGEMAAAVARAADLGAVRVVGGGADRAGRVAARLHPRARAAGERVGLGVGLARHPAPRLGGPPDVVWAHGADALALAEALPRPARRAPLVVRLTEGPVGLARPARAVGADVAEWLDPARLVVVGTTALADHLVDDLGLPRRRVVVHPPWALPPPDVDVAPPDLPADALVVAGLGPIGWAAGTDLFLDLAARLPADLDGRPVRAVWAGPTDDARARERIDADVALRGLGDRLQVVDAPTWAGTWPAPTLAVLPAREPPLALAALDLARRGVPVVGSTTSGLTEVLPGDGPADVLVPPFDGTGLAALVTDLLDAPDARRALGAEQRAHVTRHHQPEARIADLWADVAGRLARG